MTNEKLLEIIQERRVASDCPPIHSGPENFDKNSLIGLALSGGGIRSAAYSSGVLAGFHSSKKLLDVDVISSVSGGGYVPLAIMADAELAESEKIFSANGLYKRVLGNLNDFNKKKAGLFSKGIAGLIFGVLLFCAIAILCGYLISTLKNIFIENYINFIAVFLLFPIFSFLLSKFSSKRDIKPQRSMQYVAGVGRLITFGFLIISGIFLGDVLSQHSGLEQSLSFAIGVAIITVLSTQKNPKNNWILYLTRELLRSVLGRVFRATLVAVIVFFFASLATNRFFPNFRESVPVLVSQILVAVAVAGILIWGARSSNKNSMLELYKNYLEVVIGKGDAKMEANTAYLKWFPICVANITVLDRGIHRHAAISKAGVQLPSEKDVFPWASLTNNIFFSTYKGAMALSGAALDVGIVTSRLYRYIITTFNISTGIWLERKKDGVFSDNGPTKFRDLRLIFDDNASAANSRFMKLSDGGHFENTGIFYLLTQEFKVIYSFDASFDPDDLGDSFRRLCTLARQELDIEIEFDTELNSVAIFKILYSNGDVGSLYYIKHTRVKLLSKNWGKDISKDFPNDSTFNQFISSDLFDAYYQLGRDASRDLFASLKITTR